MHRMWGQRKDKSKRVCGFMSGRRPVGRSLEWGRPRTLARIDSRKLFHLCYAQGASSN